MASRHVDVNERRLRPVYDALDSMNNKQAIHLADKILKKQKDLHCAKAPEGEVLLKEIMQAQPADDPTLQAMTICYREMQKPEMIPAIYEIALKHSPNNEELHSHLFMAYVRIGEYKKQQQAALSLYKQFSKNPYYFWAVMSIVMQALVASDERLGRTMLFPLAERMVIKFINEDKIEAEAEVRLYLMILEKLEHYEKALGVLRSSLAVKLVSYMDEKEEKEASYLLKLCRWHEANVAFKKLILNREIPDFTTEAVHEFLASVVENEKAKEKKLCRGPFLAQLEMEKLCKQECIYSKLGSNSIVDLLVEYFKRFGDKPSCFWDLVPYVDLDLQHQVDAEKFIETLKSTLSSPSDEDTESSHIALSKEYMKHHRDGLVYGQKLLPTELQHSDGYAQLAVHLLLDVNREKGATDMNWHLLIMLESALKTSPSNHHLKLLLMRVYCSMGAISPCLVLFQGLEIKHIERDTLGYCVTRYVEALGQFEAASSMFLGTLKFFYGNQKNTPEHIIAAYKYGSFEKIPEFIDFKKQLDLSLHFASVNFENMLLDVFLKTSRCPRLFHRKQPLGQVFPSKGLDQRLERQQRSENTSVMGPSRELPPLGPPCSRLQGFIDGEHGNTLLAMLRVCQQSHHLFNATKDASSKDCRSRIQEDLELVSRILKECTAKCIGNLTAGSEEKTMFNGYVLEPLVLLVESFCCVTLITGVCCRFLQKLTGGKKARKKKPVPAQANEEVMPFKEFLCTLQSSMADLHTALVEVNIVQLSDDLLELNLVELDKETKSSIVSEIWEKLQTSYKKSVKEISELLHLKMKFAKSLEI
ncbi:N-alpha-acetyltransferase 25 [Acropora cervicornis]|uniref:N-alpha-acetyltransferase 25 n=1 Tax=Acropora cervicornis TaxID=6130 RepID=A0AAD9PTU6_ACRCE|nr:N-alpha-acetyltransferase 25 [Acropora cervicornis]